MSKNFSILIRDHYQKVACAEAEPKIHEVLTMVRMALWTTRFSRRFWNPSRRFILAVVFNLSHHQISWIFVINQVPCVSPCWGGRRLTRGLQRK